MRSVLFALVALAACSSKKSKLDVDRGADVDALWALAPDNTELGLVASPRAVGLAFRAIAAVRGLTAHPDFAPAKAQLDALARGMFGSETATPEDAGFSSERAFAMFATSDGVIGLMPVGDRDKFMAAKNGTRGSAEDTLEGNTCRMVGKHYVCATNPAMFDRIGKGWLRGKLQLAGARGDAELYMAKLLLMGTTPGELAIAAQLDKGQLSVHGRWAGVPSGLLQQVAGVTAPKPDTKGASGFVTFNAAPLLGSLPSVPIAGGVTTEQLAASMVGPITAVIPSGSIDIQVQVPLNDPKPATTIVENCSDVGRLFALATNQTPGACRIVLEGTNALELDIWVEGTTLRLGAHKGPVPAGAPGSLTAVGRELAATEWTAALWGRGTMLNLGDIKPTQQDVPDQVALGIHAMALVNELGAAAKIEADGARFRAFVRTAWANPDDLVAKYIAIGGRDILAGKSTEAARPIVASAPTSAFAADFAAGQGGLMIPAAVIGIVTAIAIPAIARYMGSADAGGEPPVEKSDLASLLVRAYVEEAYPKWQADNPGKKCPAKLEELATYLGGEPGIPVLTDPWGQSLVMQCDDKGIVVLSIGEDGQAGTADDVRSL